jgi:hypothetical protein
MHYAACTHVKKKIFGQKYFFLPQCTTPRRLRILGLLICGRASSSDVASGGLPSPHASSPSGAATGLSTRRSLCARASLSQGESGDVATVASQRIPTRSCSRYRDVEHGSAPVKSVTLCLPVCLPWFVLEVDTITINPLMQITSLSPSFSVCSSPAPVPDFLCAPRDSRPRGCTHETAGCS